MLWTSLAVSHAKGPLQSAFPYKTESQNRAPILIFYYGGSCRKRTLVWVLLVRSRFRG